MKFTELNLEEGLLEAISYMGFENATPIQEKAIPFILDNKDLIACAQTGTGKTGAFVLPILNKLVGNTKTETNTLIIVPTRELAIQIEQVARNMGSGYKTNAAYGGQSFNQDTINIKHRPAILVGTPGRIADHIRRKSFELEMISLTCTSRSNENTSS